MEERGALLIYDWLKGTLSFSFSPMMVDIRTKTGNNDGASELVELAISRSPPISLLANEYSQFTTLDLARFSIQQPFPCLFF